MNITLVEKIVTLIRDTSSSLPDDVLKALRGAMKQEAKGSSAAVVLDTILKNCQLAKRKQVPLCQDTGTLTFFVSDSLKRRVTPAVLKRAVAIATERGYLRKNCIDSVTGRSFDDNCADGAPVVHYVDEVQNEELRMKNGGTVTLLMKGGGSENMSRQYSLPDSALGAGRDLTGVKKCVHDAVRKIQGYGCAPGILGICIGGDRATGFEEAKMTLLRKVGQRAKGELGKLEKEILEDANRSGIGPMGLGGRTTLLDAHVVARPRVPASFFVTIAYMCWACRRRTISI